MFELFNDIWKFLSNRQHDWSAKASVGGIVVFTVLIFELSTGVFSNIINYQRISQLNAIDDALRKQDRDSVSVAYLNHAKRDLVDRGVFPSISFRWIWDTVKPVPVARSSSKQNEISKFLRQKNVVRSLSIYGFWIIVLALLILIYVIEFNFRLDRFFVVSGIVFEIVGVVVVLIILARASRDFEWRWEILINVVFQILSVRWYFWRDTKKKVAPKEAVKAGSGREEKGF